MASVVLLLQCIAKDLEWREATGHADGLRKARNQVQQEVAKKKKAKEPCDEMVAQIADVSTSSSRRKRGLDADRRGRSVNRLPISWTEGRLAVLWPRPVCFRPSQFDKQIIEADGKVKVLKEELDKMVSKIGNIVDPR